MKQLFLAAAVLISSLAFAELTPKERSQIAQLMSTSEDRADAVLSAMSCDGKSLAEAGIDVQKIKELVKAHRPALNEACLSIDIKIANEKLDKITTLTAKQKAFIVNVILTGGEGRTAATLSAMTCDGNSLSETNVDVKKMVELIKLGESAVLNEPCLSINVKQANEKIRVAELQMRSEAMRRQYEAERRETGREPNYGCRLCGDDSDWSPEKERAMIQYLGLSRPAGKRRQ